MLNFETRFRDRGYGVRMLGGVREWLLDGNHLETVVDDALFFGFGAVCYRLGRIVQTRKFRRWARQNPLELHRWAQVLRQAELEAAEDLPGR